MAVERFTIEKIFAFGNAKESRGIIANPASGGSVAVAVNDGQDWISTDTFTVANAYELYTGGFQVRITPSAGSSYSIDTAEGNL